MNVGTTGDTKVGVTTVDTKVGATAGEAKGGLKSGDSRSCVGRRNHRRCEGRTLDWGLWYNMTTSHIVRFLIPLIHIYKSM